nr:ribonuclease I [Salmonella enterica subsp. enterica serovar Give str. 564]
MNTIWHYSPLLAALLTPIFAANADELQAQQYGDFTDYVLALSWQTGFCQSQHERRHREPDECRLQKRASQQNRLSDRPRLVAWITQIYRRTRC